MGDAVLAPERILQAAEDVLRRFGPEKATVVDVARALGVTHGSVYRHFASKAALRDAVVRRWLETMMPPLEAVAAEEGPGPRAAAAVARYPDRREAAARGRRSGALRRLLRPEGAGAGGPPGARRRPGGPGGPDHRRRRGTRRVHRGRPRRGRPRRPPRHDAVLQPGLRVRVVRSRVRRGLRSGLAPPRLRPGGAPAVGSRRPGRGQAGSDQEVVDFHLRSTRSTVR